MSNHPPKPRLTLRVGLTGHRPKQHRYPPGSIDRVTTGISSWRTLRQREILQRASSSWSSQRYFWADALAVYLANVYRSAYIIVYLLSAFAVALGLGGFFSHAFSMNTALAFKGTLAFFELILIFGIIRIVRIGRLKRWHQRFLEYRTLAEMLRDVRFLAYVGENGRILRTNELDPGSWFLWYLRATIRELGLPSAVLDGTYQRAHLTTVEEHAVESQIDYHRRNAMTLDKMDYIIHRVGDACF
jgi:hypothetical protein